MRETPRLSPCFDLFNVVRADGQWVIASVADTGRKDCVRK